MQAANLRIWIATPIDIKRVTRTDCCPPIPLPKGRQQPDARRATVQKLAMTAIAASLAFATPAFVDDIDPSAADSAS
jgi:hypothetical protein